MNISKMSMVLYRSVPILAMVYGVPAMAQDFPSGPITVVVPFSAGGIADTSCRFASQQLSSILGTNVVVENRTGAGGRIGATYVAQARPDGLTLLCGGASALVIEPAIAEEEVSYVPQEDFVPIGFFNEYNMVVAGPASSDVQTMGDLVEAMTSDPGSISYGSAGSGTPLGLAGAWLPHVLGVEVEAINYPGSTAALVDLLGGRLDYLFASPQSLAAQIEAGEIVGLAIAADARNELLPDVPTMVEAGLPEYMSIGWSQWNGLFAPADTPQPALERLNAALNEAMESAELQERFVTIGTEVRPTLSLDEAAAFYAETFEQWIPALQALGLAR